MPHWGRVVSRGRYEFFFFCGAILPVRRFSQMGLRGVVIRARGNVCSGFVGGWKLKGRYLTGIVRRWRHAISRLGGGCAVCCFYNKSSATQCEGPCNLNGPRPVVYWRVAGRRVSLLSLL